MAEVAAGAEAARDGRSHRFRTSRTASREDRRAGLMWVKVGNDCLNLDNIVSFHFARDDDGVLAVIVETISGHVKHYQGNEAAMLKQHFDTLTAAPPEPEPFEPL